MPFFSCFLIKISAIVLLTSITGARFHAQQVNGKTVELEEVRTSATRLVEKNFGLYRNFSPLRFSDGSVNQQNNFEIAQLISINKKARITSVNLFINESRNDSGLFRISFYNNENGRPGEKLIEKTLMKSHPINEGWLRFDLREYNIHFRGPFIVAVEFVPSQKNMAPIFYGIRIGGRTKSFVRTGSQGEWQVPPHHYRLFVTALVAEGEKQEQQNDFQEEPGKPAFGIYSESVMDSFTIFVHLPKNNSKKKYKKYPVVFLLDANMYFDVVASQIEENKTQAILVGIGYKDFLAMDSLRNRDYTFPVAVAADSFVVSGGGERFLKFTRTELLPTVEKNYRCQSENRTLMGHSLGGYFTLFALAEELTNGNSVFSRFVAASPSLHYGDGYIVKQFTKLEPNNNSPARSLYLTVGEREESENTSPSDFEGLIETFKEKKFSNLRVKGKVFSGFDHMETAVPSFIDALE